MEINAVMENYTVVIEGNKSTGLLTGYVEEYPDVRAQGATVEEVRRNLREQMSTLLEDDEMFWPPMPGGDGIY